MKKIYKEPRKKIPVPDKLRENFKRDAAEILGIEAVYKSRNNKAAFACCIMDWLKDVQILPETYVKMLLKEERPVSAMWDCYRQNPILGCRTASDIVEILDDMQYYRKICLAA